jgi:hypothetical protein
LAKRLKDLAKMELSRDQLLLKLGAAQSQFPAASRLVTVQVPEKESEIHPPNFIFQLRKDKLRQSRRREGRYLLRSNLSAQEPEKLWRFLHSTHASGSGLQRLQGRLEPAAHFPLLGAAHRGAHFYFLSGLLFACQFARLLEAFGPGLTPRSLLEKFAAMHMLDVHFPTTDGRELVCCRYTQPEKDHKMLLAQLGWQLPPQSPPRITQKGQLLPE